MMKALHIGTNQRNGEYRDVLDFLFENRTEHGSASFFAAKLIRQSTEFKRWKRTRSRRRVNRADAHGVSGD